MAEIAADEPPKIGLSRKDTKRIMVKEQRLVVFWGGPSMIRRLLAAIVLAAIVSLSAQLPLTAAPLTVGALCL